MKWWEQDQSSLLYGGMRDAEDRGQELKHQWFILPSYAYVRSRRYWHLYEYDKVYRTEEKRKFYFEDVWSRKYIDPPSVYVNKCYYERACICCLCPVSILGTCLSFLSPQKTKK